MARDLWGLDCCHPGCIHPGVGGHRLDFFVRRLRPPAFTDEQWERRRTWERERSPVTFRTTEFKSALDQLAALGVPEPQTGEFVLDHTQTPALPPGYDKRRVRLSSILLPRTALYFRWEPSTGQVLTPDLIFQCNFKPDATPHERATAYEIPISPEAYTTVIRRNETWSELPGVRQLATSTLLKCQHCHRALPLKALSTTSLRRVEKGD